MVLEQALDQRVNQVAMGFNPVASNPVAEADRVLAAVAEADRVAEADQVAVAVDGPPMVAVEAVPLPTTVVEADPVPTTVVEALGVVQDDLNVLTSSEP